MDEFITNTLDIFFYTMGVFVLLYYVFTTSTSEKIKDAKVKIKKISDMFTKNDKQSSKENQKKN